jgi:hypothetical protein
MGVYKVAEPLPSHLRRATTEEVDWLERETSKYVEKVHIPSQTSPNHWMLWPSVPLKAQVVPGELHPFDADAGFDHDKRLERFFAAVAPDGVAVWVPDMEDLGYFVGVYNTDFRTWVGQNLAISTHLFLSNMKNKFIYIIDRDLEISILGAEMPEITLLHNEFGGENHLRNEFIAYANQAGGGWFPNGAEWIKDVVMPRCGWLE